MRTKTLLRIALVLLLVLLLLCGTAFAYMFRQTQLQENQLTPASVSCRVAETFNGTAKSSITVENTGNIASFIRVRFVSYWVDEDGNTVGKASEMPTIQTKSGWLTGSNHTYYYAIPVAAGGSTPELLAAPIVLSVSEEGYLQVVEVFAEAIQSEPERSVETSWDVTVSGGSITGVS